MSIYFRMKLKGMYMQEHTHKIFSQTTFIINLSLSAVLEENL